MSEKLSDDDKKLLGQLRPESGRNTDGSLKAPEQAEQDNQDRVREEQLQGAQVGDRPKNARRRKADEDKDEKSDQGSKERLTPAQFENDGHEDVPAQYSFEAPAESTDGKDSKDS